MKRPLAAAFTALTLAACATPTLYQPAVGPRAVGFSEYRIEPGRYRVTFRGGGGAPAPVVNDFALRRAAELTLADGYDWFRIVDRYEERSGPAGEPRVSVGVGGMDFGRSSSVGLGLGTSFALGGGPVVVRTIEVFMGKGARPEGQDTYDARAIVEWMRAPMPPARP